MRRAPVRPRAWITLSLAIAATILVLSGCGGGSASSSSSSAPATSSSTNRTSQTSQGAAQFKAALAPVQFKSASQATGAALQRASSQNDAQLATTFQQLAAKWTSAISTLETLQPPPQLTAAYNRLKSHVSQVKQDLAAIVSAAQSHDATAAKDAATKLVNDIVAAKAASTTLSSGTS